MLIFRWTMLLLLLGELLRPGGLLHRVHLEWQQSSKLACNPADAGAQSLIAKHAANGSAERLADLSEQVAEESLRGELLLLRLLLLLLGELLHVGRHHWISLERQQSSELARNATDVATQTRLPEHAANGAAQWLAHLSEQVAEEALRRHLLSLALPLTLLGLPCLLLRQLLRIGGCYRVHLEGQESAELACSTTQRAAQTGLSEDAADGATERLADLAQQIAEESLRGELALTLTLTLLLLQLLL